MSKNLAHAGQVSPFASLNMVCPNCGSAEIKATRKADEDSAFCAICGNDGFAPILQSAFIAAQLRER